MLLLIIAMIIVMVMGLSSVPTFAQVESTIDTGVVAAVA